VRALLRDYADQDLSPADREQVDEHAHHCRECGIALSRVEAEVYRLRRALREPVAEPGEDFVRRVMVRVRAEAAADAPSDDAVSPDFTPRVMERIRREWRRPSAGARAASFVRRHAVSLLTVGVVAFLAVWLRLGAGSGPSSFQILTAERTQLRRGVHAFEPAAGEFLLPGDVLDVAHSGRAVIAIADDDGADRLRVEADAGSVLYVLQPGDRLRAPLFDLRVGTLTMRVADPRGAEFSIGADCRISAEPGEYVVFAEHAARHDGGLAFEPVFTAVRLEAVRGRVRIERGSAAPAWVEAREAALFDPWSAVAIERCLDEQQLLEIVERGMRAARNEAFSEPARNPEAWIGRVISGPSGAGIVGAQVRMRIAGKLLDPVFTGPDGSFELPGKDVVENAAAIAEVVLPEGASADFNVANYVGPLTMRSVGVGPRGQQRLEPIRLPPERRVMGTVFDPDGRKLAGARVTAVAVDTLTGSAKRLPASGDDVTDGEGRFALRRLPATLPIGIDLYLLVEHAAHGSVAALDLLRDPSDRDRAISIAMVRRERVEIADLPPGEVFEVLTSIRNMAPSVMLQSQRVWVQAGGIAEIELAEGARMWLRRGDELVALAPREERLGAFLPAGEVDVPEPVRELSEQRRSWQSSVVEQGRWRFDQIVAAAGTTRRTVTLVDREGHDLAGGRLFLATKEGVGYLGEMSAPQAEWALPDGSDYRVIAVTDEGSIGIADANAQQDGMLRVRVLPPGAAALPQELITDLEPIAAARGGFLVFELVMVEPLPEHVVYRHAGRDSGWHLHGLIPGLYRLSIPDGRRYSALVPPGGVGMFVREAGDVVPPTKR